MPHAKKLASGSWNCKVVDHYEYVDGKRKAIRKSITVSDPSEKGRIECERKAIEYIENRNRLKRGDLTVKEAIDKYLEVKNEVLSFSTVRSYRCYAKNAYFDIANIRIDELTSETVQMWISKYSLTHTPKSCANANGLLSAALNMFAPGKSISVTLPKRKPISYYTPTDEDIKVLLRTVKGTEIEKAILLAAFGTLRRGEVCAVTKDSIMGTRILINKTCTRNPSGGWMFVDYAKTPESIRTVDYPKEVIDRLTSNTNIIVNLTPEGVTRRFKEAVTAAGLPCFRFHDLRAYAVSIRHALGIPDEYILMDGGYKTDYVMKKVYRRAMDDKRKHFAKITTGHFLELLS